MIDAILPGPPAASPPTGHGLGGGGAVAPAASCTGGGAGHDPAHGRRSAEPVAAGRGCGVPRDREPDAVSRARGPFGTLWGAIVDRLITRDGPADAGPTGPGTESRMVELGHAAAGRHARLATALEEAFGRPSGDAYALERAPGRAPQVVHAPQPVRVGRLLDVLA